MSMMPLSDYIPIIKYLRMKYPKYSLEKLIKEADVPLSQIEELKSKLGEEITIKSISILASDNKIKNISLMPIDNCFHLLAQRQFLIDKNPNLNLNAIENILDSGFKIVSKMTSPEVGEFSTKGLIVGYVQSGKTATIATVLNLAADHGYKFIVVFAGVLNDLRKQTQGRLDREVCGQSEELPVGELIDNSKAPNSWRRWTKDLINGDFDPGTSTFAPSPETIDIFVIKKHPAVMKALKKWLSKSGKDLSNIPALFIDDEADNASINTKYGKFDDNGDPVDPTITNQSIRDLLGLFKKNTYIGFTATPFANVLIDSEAEDLYPKDFICVLPEPQNYWGARKLFGIGLTPSELSPEEPEDSELGLIRIIPEDEAVAEPGGECPPFLAMALKCYILACCARLARNQKEHYSMLVHPSQYIDDHTEYKKIIEDELELYVKVLKYKNRSSAALLMNEFKEIWDNDFRGVSKKANSEECPIMIFSTVWKYFNTIINEINIITLNSQNVDDFSYPRNLKKNYIVIGGNKLSRGMTLEGLVTSVFFRSMPGAYDTALQMGRWFGFRNGYYDLTRIFVQQIAATSFADLARIEIELREDLRKYTIEPNPPSPLELKPLIRLHPSLLVTSLSKQGAGRKQFSFQHLTRQTISFPLAQPGKLVENIKLGQAFINSLGKGVNPKSKNLNKVFLDVSSLDVLNFINEYNFGPNSRDMIADYLNDYISKQNKHNELTLWDIVIPKGSSQKPIFNWSKNISSNTVWRSRFKSDVGYKDSIKVLSEPADIENFRIEFDRKKSDAKRAVLILYVIDKDSFSGEENALFSKNDKNKTDILGFVIDFPRSSSQATVLYMGQ